jgi:hypothetical protein
MFAVTPKADINPSHRYVRFLQRDLSQTSDKHGYRNQIGCPLYPRKQTLVRMIGVSALGQKRTTDFTRIGCPERASYWTHLRGWDVRCWIDRRRPEPFRLASIVAS